MSIEQRIRSGLAANAADVMAPVEARLDDVLRHHRRGVRIRIGLAVVATAALGATPWVVVDLAGDGSETAADSTGVPGRYAVGVPGGGATREMRGRWTVALSEDGSARVTPPPGYDGPEPGEGVAYRLDGRTFTTNLLIGWPGCQASTPAVGEYVVDVFPTGARFELVEDTCPARVRLFTSRWERLP